MHMGGKLWKGSRRRFSPLKPAEELKTELYSQATEMIYSIEQSTEADLLVMQCASLLCIKFSSHSFQPRAFPQTHSLSLYFIRLFLIPWQVAFKPQRNLGQVLYVTVPREMRHFLVVVSLKSHWCRYTSDHCDGTGNKRNAQPLVTEGMLSFAFDFSTQKLILPTSAGFSTIFRQKGFLL